MAKEPKSGGTMTLPSNSGPIGMVDGKLNVVDKDSPPFKPKVFDEDGNEVDPDEIQPDAPADE